jgi:hypothetical protein
VEWVTGQALECSAWRVLAGEMVGIHRGGGISHTAAQQIKLRNGRSEPSALLVPMTPEMIA